MILPLDTHCPLCSEPFETRDPMTADECDEDMLPSQCDEGCGQRMCGNCYAGHSQDCFDDHASAAYRAMPRRRFEL